jgi:hypothetical protein
LLTSELRAKTERRRRLEGAGWGGAAANVGAQILDPVSIGAMLATGGFGTAATAGRAGFFASRMGMAARAGLINAVPTAAGEALRASEDSRISGYEIAGNIASDFVFGGSASALADASRLRRFGTVGAATGITAGTFTAMDSDAEDGAVFASFALSSLIPGTFAALPRATTIDTAMQEVGQRMVQRADVAIATAAGTPLTDKGLKVYGGVTGEKAVKDFDETVVGLTGVYETPVIQPRVVTERPVVVAPAVDSQPAATSTSQPTTVPAAAPTTTATSQSPTQPATRQKVVIDTATLPKLPEELSKAAPRYSVGENKFTINFASDIDRAGYILAQKNPSKRDADYAKWLMEVTGADEQTVREHGIKVRDRIKAFAKKRKGGTSDKPVEIRFDPFVELRYGDKEATMPLPPKAFLDAATTQAMRPGSTSPGTAQQPGGNPLFANKDVNAGIYLHNITDSRISNIPLPAFMRAGPLKNVDLGAMRFSNAAMVGREDVAEVRLLGNMLNTDVVPKADGYAQYGAVSQVEDAVRAYTTPHEVTLTTKYDAYVKQANADGEKPVSFVQFGEAVVKEIRRFSRGAIDNSPKTKILREAAESVNKSYRDLLDYAVAHNVPRAKEVAEATKAKPYRVPRSYNRPIIDQDIVDFKARYGSEWRNRLEEAWTEAVYRDLDLTDAQKANPQRGRKLANLIAKRIIENGGTQNDLNNAIGGVGMSRDEFRRLVREVFPDATPEEVKSLAARVLADDEQAATTSLRTRAPLDETYVHTFADGTTYSIEDRLDNDPRRLFASEASNLIGAAAMAEVSRVWSARTGREGFGNLQEMVARINEVYAENGVRDSANVQRIEWAAKKMMGIPTMEAKSLSSRRAMALAQANINAQYMRLLSTPTMGAVNATDIIRATAEFGHTSILAQIPELVNMLNRAKKGDVEGLHLLAYLTQDLGIGTSAFNSGPIRQVADSNAKIDQLLAKLQDVSARGAQFGATFSAQRWTQDVGELVAGAGYIDATVKMAVNDKVPTAAQLRELGMDQAEWKRVSNQIKKHALRVDETGEAWYPNTQEWTDLEARVVYDQAIKRNVRRAMNITDPTSLPMWADTMWGRLLLQFRKFGLRAAETQLAFHADTMARGDAGLAFSRMAISSALGVMQAIIMGGFAVSTAALFGGDPNKVAEERFSTRNLALAGFGRATWSSLLPMGVDFAAASAGYKAPFSVNRVSGLGADNGAIAILTGNPTLDWAKNAIGTVEAFRTPFDSELDFTSQHVRTGINAAFVPNVFGVRDAMNYIAKDVLPERER